MQNVVWLPINQTDHGNFIKIHFLTGIYLSGQQVIFTWNRGHDTELYDELIYRLF